MLAKVNVVMSCHAMRLVETFQGVGRPERCGQLQLHATSVTGDHLDSQRTILAETEE